MSRGAQIVWGLLRISMGWTFLWPFLDKTFGLYITTEPAKAWVAGGSPTFGFLKFATTGPFAGFYQSLAGSALVEWLFMLGLLLIGLSLLLGVMTRLAVWSGVVMMLLMYTAVLPPEHNPVIDEHIIYALLLITMTFIPVGEWLGLGRKWAQTDLVSRYRWLR